MALKSCSDMSFKLPEGSFGAPGEDFGEGVGEGEKDREEGEGGGKEEGGCGEVGAMVKNEVEVWLEKAEDVGDAEGEGKVSGAGEGNGSEGVGEGEVDVDTGPSSGLMYSAIEIASEAIATTLLPTTPVVFMHAFTISRLCQRAVPASVGGATCGTVGEYSEQQRYTYRYIVGILRGGLM